MQPRRIARELALLSLSQLPNRPDKLKDQDLQTVLVAAVRTLSGEAHDTLETASSELQQSHTRLLDSEIKAIDVTSARVMVQEAIALTQTALNRLASALELPEFIQLTNQASVRSHALDLVRTIKMQREKIDEILVASLEKWNLSRIASVDRDILRLAVAEMLLLEPPTPSQVAINEAIELAKKYGDDDSFRFINGVLRRVVNRHAMPPDATSR